MHPAAFLTGSALPPEWPQGGGLNGINQTVNCALSFSVSEALAVEKAAVSRTKRVAINILYMINLTETVNLKS